MLHQKNFQLVSAGSLGADYTSPSVDLTVYYGASLQAVWTGGSANGTLSLQVSNDGVNWSDLTGSDIAVSGAGNFTWDLTQTNVAYVRIIFAYTSGTGSLSIQVNGKTP